MGKRPASVGLFEGNMASIQREIGPSMQRDEPPTMETGLEQIAVRVWCKTPLLRPKLRVPCRALQAIAALRSNARTA